MIAARTTPPARIVFDDAGLDGLSPAMAADVKQAVLDLSHANRFEPVGVEGASVVHVSARHGRLVLGLRDATGTTLREIGLALGPLRRLIGDYLLLIDSHEDASRHASAERIEAIDIGRRGLHNEGAEMIVERLRGKVAIDFETARRLFTLACALQHR